MPSHPVDSRAQADALLPALAFALRGPAMSSSDILRIAFVLLPLGGGVRSLLAVLSSAGPSGTGVGAAATGGAATGGGCSTAAAAVPVSPSGAAVPPPTVAPSTAGGLGMSVELDVVVGSASWLAVS